MKVYPIVKQWRIQDLEEGAGVVLPFILQKLGMKLEEIGPRRRGCTFLEPPGPANVKQQIFLDCALYHISMHLSSSGSESIFQLRARW